MRGEYSIRYNEIMLLALVALLCSVASVPIPIIVDTDTSLTIPHLHDVDDDLALLLALSMQHHGQYGRQSRAITPTNVTVDVLGVIATFGNAHSNATYADAVSLLEQVARPHRAHTLRVAKSGDYGSSLLAVTEGTDLMRSLLRTAERPVTVVCLGAMYTLAAAVTQEPGLVDRIEKIVMMGGSDGTGPSLIQSVGDLNWLVDPASANVLMRLPVPKTVITPQLCIQVPFIRHQFDRIGSDSSCEGSVVRAHLPKLKKWYRNLQLIEDRIYHNFPQYKPGGPFPWDTIAMGAIVFPELVLGDVQCKELRLVGPLISIKSCKFPDKHELDEKSGSSASGWSWSGRASVPMAMADHQGFLKALVDGLCAIKLKKNLQVD